ncbi:MAG: oligosaccharide flippase family protein, partial [Candidatus Aenigmarchaeota archaeon]|nr:oligosaccharide flippase family protein [Candidatus Aenigmarchaeota archaeon]
FSSISWIGIGYAARKFSRFPLLQSWSKLLLSLGAQLPAIFMAAFYGVEVVGLFGLANGMVNMPMNLLGRSVAQVYYAEIAKYGKSRPDKIRKLSISIIKKMFFVGIIPMGAIMVAGPWMFSFVFGAEWHDAGVYARLLSIAILSGFITTPIAHCLNVLEMQGSQLFINVIRVVLVVVVFMACKIIGLSSFVAIAIHSVAYASFRIVVLSFILIRLKQYQKF